MLRIRSKFNPNSIRKLDPNGSLGVLDVESIWRASTYQPGGLVGLDRHPFEHL